MTKKIQLDRINNLYFSYNDLEHLKDEFAAANNLLQTMPSGTKIKKGIDLETGFDFSYSYIKIDQKIYALSPVHFNDKDSCTVKGGMDEDGFFYAIKIEKKSLPYNRESKISIDMDLQEGLRALRKTTRGYKRYAAQNFRGSSTLFDYLVDSYELPHTLRERLIERLTFARNLCVEVDAMHSGRAAQTRTAYMHGDLKPENMVVDEDTKAIRLIDFGTAISMQNASSFKSTDGRTFPYLPYDSYGTKDNAGTRDDVLKNMSQMDAQSIDLFAVVRTLFFPTHSYFTEHDYRSIFTREVYDQLPLPIQSLLQTHFEEDRQDRDEMFTTMLQNFTKAKYTAKFFAAIFAYLLELAKADQPLTLEQGWLKTLQKNVSMQDKLLQDCICFADNSESKKQYAEFSPLYMAVGEDSVYKIQNALKIRRNPNQPCMNSNSLLMEAILSNRMNAAYALLGLEDIDLNYQNDHGCTVLTYAIRRNNLTVLKILCEKNARLDLADVDGNTPLHIAIVDQNVAAARLLIENNAPLSVLNKNNASPLTLAFEMGLTEIATLIAKTQRANQTAVNTSNLTYRALRDKALNAGNNPIEEGAQHASDLRTYDNSVFRANIACPNLFLFPALRLKKEQEKQEQLETVPNVGF